MFGQQYDYELVPKYVAAFGNLFNEIYIPRTDSQGNITQYIKVPLTYANKDKMLAVVKANPEELKSSQINLPIISFEIATFEYVESRKLNTLNRIVRKSTNPDKVNYIYESVVYDLGFNVYIWAKNRSDAMRIIEKILPNFKTNWDMTLNILPSMNILLDTPVILRSVSFEDKMDGKLEGPQTVTFTLNFTMKAQFFGPTKSKPIIKTSKQIYHFGNPGEDNVAGELVITPGLTANGDPTTVANQSINIHSIAIDSDFGFVVEEDGLNGIVFTGNT